jgi:outer membrane protein
MKTQSKLILLVIAVTCLSGCMQQFIRDTGPEHQALLNVDVNQIDAVTLEALSKTEPISIDQAAAQYKADLIENENNNESISLSLADIRASALSNNLQLKVDLVNPSMAQQQYLAERAKFEAAFFGGIQYSDSTSPTASQLETAKSSNTAFEIGLRQPLPTGGNITIRQPNGRYDNDNQFSILNPSFASDLRFTISQPLLRGAGMKTNTHSIRVARLQEKMSEAQTKLQAIRVLADADCAYWRVYGASQELFVSQQQYQLAERQLAEARLRVESGAAPQVEIVRAESGVAARREGIIISLTNLRLYERDLKRIMNRDDMPLDSITGILPQTDPTPLKIQLDPKELVAFAINNRMEIFGLELQIAIDQSLIDASKNARLPGLSVESTVNINGLGNSFGKSYDDIRSGEFTDWSLGLQGEIPLGNKAANARLRYAKLALTQRLATKEQRSQLIEQEVLNAIDLLEQNWQRILASRQDVLFAARTYQAERKQFEQGVRTSTDVLLAAGRLATAQLREVRALIDYQIAQVDIALSTGTLLGQAGIQWQPMDL